MALPLKKTLGEMRAELLDRLGFASQGSSAGSIISTADSYLQRAQNYLYWKYDFNELNKTYDWSTAQGQTLYDWPDDMEPRKVIELRTLWNSYWHPMHEGISFQHDSVADVQYYPLRYDRRAQLEVWPEPNAIYTIRGEYYKRLDRFTLDNDRVTLDEHLVFTYALAKAKKHYRQPDANDYMEELGDLITQLRIAAHGNNRYIRGDNAQDVQREPVTVDYQ